MSLTSLGSMPQPSLAWQFESSNVDSVTGLAPNTSVGPPTYVSGKYGQAINLPNPVINGTTPPTYQLTYTISIQNTMTYCFWVNFAINNVFGQSPVCIPGVSNSYLDGSGKFHINSTNDVTMNFVMSTGVWYHVALVFSGGVSYGYINGQYYNQGTAPATFSATTLYVGSQGVKWAANCSIDDLRIYNTALSATQIQVIYTENAAPASNLPMPQPSLAWQFESSNVDYVTNLSPLASNNNTISYSNGKFGSSIVTNLNLPAVSPSSYLQYNLNAPSVTITCWIRPWSVSTASNQIILGIADSNTTVNNWLQFIVNASSMFVYGQNPAGGTPLLTVQSAGVSVSNGVWYHVALSMNSTGSVFVYLNGSVSNQIQQYSAGVVNGVFGTLWNTWTAKSIVMGSNTRFPGLNSGAWCDFDDLRVYNTVLNATQIQSIYVQNGMPGRGVQTNRVGLKTTFNGNSLFSRLSAAASSNLVGAFSLRAVNGVATKAVQIRRSSDAATQDFYVDRLGNLLTAPVTGTPLATWLGSATGNVVTFYSQYGTSTATQTTGANQLQVINGLPQFSTALNGGAGTFYPFTSINLGSIDGSYSKAFWVYATSNASQFDNFITTSTAASGQGINNLGWSFNTGTSTAVPNFYQNTFGIFLTSYSFPLNTWTHLACTYSNPTQTVIVYKNGAQIYSNTAWTSSFNPGDGALATGLRMGKGFGNACNAQVYDVLIFNSALSSADITTLYNSRLY